METLLFERVILPLVVVAIPALFGWIIKQLNEAAKDRKQAADEQREHNALSIEADKVLYHDRLSHLCKSIIRDGFCTFADRDNLTYLYKTYKRLGGNHGIDDKYKKAMAQKVRED